LLEFDTPKEKIEEGISFHKEGNLIDAKKIYKQLVDENPENYRANYLLGVLLGQERNYEEATKYFKKALDLEFPNAELFYNLGLVLQESNEFKEAMFYYKKSIELDSLNPYTLNNCGNVYKELGLLEEAISYYLEAIKVEPLFINAYNNCGNILRLQGKKEEALNYFNEAIKKDEKYSLSYYNRGVIKHDLGQELEGLDDYKKAVDLGLEIPEIYFNIANIYKKSKNQIEAINYYDKAINLDNNYAEAYSNKADVLVELNKFDDALKNYRRAQEINPNIKEIYNNIGLIYAKTNDYKTSLHFYRKAIEIDKNFCEVYFNMGFLDLDNKKLDEALKNFKKTYELNKNYEYIQGIIVHLKMQMCLWEGIEEEEKEIIKAIKQGKKATLVFPLLSMTDDEEVHNLASKLYLEDKYPLNESLGEFGEKKKKDKITIGYYSGDFKTHPVSILSIEFLENHNKEKFNIVGFSFTSNKSDLMQKRIANAFDKFIYVADQSDREVAEISRKMDIDIAVDMTGLTSEARTGIFSYRAAPIQINYLAFPGTMNASYIDYIIADNIVIPEQSQNKYKEKIIYLPNSILPRDTSIKPILNKFNRKDFKLPKNTFVYCSFNASYKINPLIFNSWMRILSETENSVLWLNGDNQFMRINIIKEAQKKGIDAKRIIFAEKTKKIEDHYSRLELADLFLDSTPYNAHTTASDSLWVGLPVLTCIGKSFAGRVAAGLLNAIDMNELIAKNLKEYEEIAIKLGNDNQKIKELKIKIKENSIRLDLFNTSKYTKNIELAYIKIYDLYQNNIECKNLIINGM